MPLPHALILELPINFDDGFNAARQLTDAGDYVIEIAEHKSSTGSTIGIFIDDIRLVRDAVKTNRQSVRTVVIFHDGSKMTKQAQNALLKLLEEPRQNLHFILVTSRTQALLETVRSRCHLTHFVPNPPGNLTLPAKKQAKIKFMAAGDRILEQKLAQNDKFYDSQVEIYETAKKFVSGNPLERLEAIATVKESREEAIQLVGAALTVCRFMLIKHYSLDFYNKTKQLLEADNSLRNNANVRLSLLTCVV